MERGTLSKERLQAAAAEFIQAAVDSGVISAQTQTHLLEFAAERFAPAPPEPDLTSPESYASRLPLAAANARLERLAVRLTTVAPPHRTQAASLHAKVMTIIESGDLALKNAAIDGVVSFLAAIAAPETPVSQAPAPEPPRPKSEQTRPQPSVQKPVAAKPAASQPRLPTTRPPTTVQAPRPLPAAPARPRFELREKLRGLWSTLSADFAANTLVYLGVLLSIVVIFVFFAFGYFGEAVKTPSLRPPIFVAVPLLFLGLAWVLRSRTGLPAAANAIGMIGALIVPIMLTALFQDNVEWSTREGVAGWFPLTWVPNLDGPDRWYGYAIVGVISAGVYLALTMRNSIYAYGVFPMLWAVAGALGLYWRHGMSGPQLFTVLTAMVVGIVLVSRWRDTRIGRVVAVPTVRIGVVAAPFVFALSLIFAYNDALETGVAVPTFADLAWPSAIAAALMAAILGVASGTEFAWEDLGPRTRRGMMVGLRVAAYIAAGMALVLGLSLDATPGWLGVALLGYGLAVWAIDRLLGGTGDAAVWIARASIGIGLVLSLYSPEAAIVAWSTAGVLAIARALVPAVARFTASLVPVGEDPIVRYAELWIPVFVVVGFGAARLVTVEHIPLVLIFAAGIAVTTAWLPTRAAALRSFAAWPTVAFGAGAALSAYLIHTDVSRYSDREIGLGLAALAIIAALTAFPWTWRITVVVGTGAAAIMMLTIDAIDPGVDGALMIVTGVLIGTAVALIGASSVPAWRRWALPHAALGHLALYGSLLSAATVEDALLASVAAIVVVNGVEAVMVRVSRVPFIEDLIADYDWPPVTRQIPSFVAWGGLLPLALLVGRQIAWIRAEDARVSLLLSGLAIAYALGAWIVSKPELRLWSALLGYGAAGSALIISAGSGPLLLTALSAAAVATFILALALGQPLASVVSWVFGFGAVLVAASEAGVDSGHLYRPLLGAALPVVLVSSIVVAFERRHSVINAWTIIPGIVGVVAAFAGMAGASIDDQSLWAWAVATGVAMLAFTAAHRIGGLIVTVWTCAGVAYVDLLEERIAADPVWLLPLAGALVLVSAVLPGRRSWRFVADPAPITTVSGLAVAAVAVAWSVADGTPAVALAWSSAIVAAVWAIRREEPWIHLAGGLLIAAGADAGSGWLTAGLATVATLETVTTELRRDKEAARAYAWLATVLWTATYIVLLGWLESAEQTVVFLTLGVGIAAATAAFVWWLARPKDLPTHRWMVPLAVVGHMALVGSGVYASTMLSTSGAYLTWSAVAATEAVFFGFAGTRFASHEAVWVSSGLLAGAAWMFAEGLGFTRTALMWTGGGIGAALLVLWGVLEATEPHPRINLWKWPVMALAQAAIVGSAAAAAMALSTPLPYGAWLILLSIEAVVFATVATVVENEGYAFLAAGSVLAGIGTFVAWQQIEAGQVVVWFAAAGVLATAASVVTRYHDQHGGLTTWLWPLHAATVTSAGLGVANAWLWLTLDEARLVGALVAALAGTYVLVNRRLIDEAVPVEIGAAGAFVVSAGLAVSTLDAGSPWAVLALLGVGGLGLLAASMAGAAIGQRRQAWATMAIGFSGIAVVAAAILYQVVSAEVGWLLIVVGGAFAAYAIAARQQMAFHGAVLTWLAALLILIEETWQLELHSAVLLVAVVLLFMMESERFRCRRAGIDIPGWLSGAEWVAMVAPLMLAGIEMVVTSLAYGILLGLEGAALIVWGGVTRVRRRAMLGLSAVTAAILLAVLIPLIEGLRGGLTGGWWLVIGAVAAAMFIATGSMIEKFRTRIGRELAKWSEILEDWE